MGQALAGRLAATEVSRAALLARLAGLITVSDACRPTRVAIDGPDAAGKTTLADELARELHALGKDVIRASIDGFHRPRKHRYRRGRLSARGYLEDSFDLDALRTALLEPLGPGGDRGTEVPCSTSAATDRFRALRRSLPSVWCCSSTASSSCAGSSGRHGM